MPWSYLPTLFALQLPEVMLVLMGGAVISTFALLPRRGVPARRKTILLMLTLAATLPLAIAMVKRPALYNGIRHFVFVIPPMAVLGGVAFAWTMREANERKKLVRILPSEKSVGDIIAKAKKLPPKITY